MSAQAVEEWREWNRPVEPFRIADGLYYVGAADIGAYLFTTPAGHVLLDGGFPETAAQIVGNVEKLGFRIEEVRFLISSHAHFDHAGGLAALKSASGAQLVASERDAPQLESGGRGDFAWGDEYPFPPVVVDRRIGDRETVELGGLVLTAQLTPGHTKGCTSWTARLRDGERELDALFVCSLSVPDPASYRLAGNPRYPGIADDYRRSFERLDALPCELFLGAHGWIFGLEEKRARLGGEVDPFVDPDGCRAYLERSRRRFEQLVAEASGEPRAEPSD